MKLSSSILFTDFSQKHQKFQPPFKGSADLKVFPSKSSYHFSNDMKENEETDDGSYSTNRHDGLWGGEGFRDYTQGACQSNTDEDEILQDSDHATISRRCLSLDCSQTPPLRRR